MIKRQTLEVYRDADEGFDDEELRQLGRELSDLMNRNIIVVENLVDGSRDSKLFFIVSEE